MPSPLEELPSELFYRVLDYCSQGALAALSRASECLNEVTIPVLYHHVNLSVHHSDEEGHRETPTMAWGRSAPIDFKTRFPCPLAFVNRLRHAMDDETHRRQQLLTRTLSIDNPCLGRHVRHLTWTILNSKDEAAQPFERSDHGQYFYPGSDDRPLWKAFGAMTRIQVVDIHWLRSYREPIACVREWELPDIFRNMAKMLSRYPVQEAVTDSDSSRATSIDDLSDSIRGLPPLFTAATSISLGGQCSYNFVTSLLSGLDLSAVHTLRLNNVQQFGELESVPPDTARKQHSGPMHGHLDTFLTHRAVLRSLHISTTGVKVFDEPGRYEHWEAVYVHWASLLRHASTSLEELSFEQGSAFNAAIANPYLTMEDSPMGQFLIRHIITEILGNRWPRLKKLQIRGLGCWRLQKAEKSLDSPMRHAVGDSFTAVFDEPDPDGRGMIRRTNRYDATCDAIRKHLGTHVELLLTDPAQQDYECCWRGW